jgi:hypothetical protein
MGCKGHRSGHHPPSHVRVTVTGPLVERKFRRYKRIRARERERERERVRERGRGRGRREGGREMTSEGPKEANPRQKAKASFLGTKMSSQRLCDGHGAYARRHCHLRFIEMVALLHARAAMPTSRGSWTPTASPRPGWTRCDGLVPLSLAGGEAEAPSPWQSGGQLRGTREHALCLVSSLQGGGGSWQWPCGHFQ